MSYLNALASDGLSVGLRFYTAKLNERAPETLALPVACPPEPEESVRQRAKAAAPPSQTAEEVAVGRTEAQARLAEDGSLGRLQAKSQAGADNQAQESQIKADLQTSAKNGESGVASVQYTYTTGPDDNRYISGVQGGGAGETAAASAQTDPRRLSEEEREQVEEMKDRDREVKTHEQAHVAAAAGLAGAPVYEYQTGPDGRRYAGGGQVEVKTSGSSNPDRALREAEAVKRAATAPADPSGADQAAAARASAEINRLKAERASGGGEDQEEGQSDNKPRARLNGPEENGNSNGYGPNQIGAAAIHNGSSFGQQALGAYAAAKFGLSNAMVRPVLAQV